MTERVRYQRGVLEQYPDVFSSVARQALKSHGIFRDVNTEVGQIIVAEVDQQRVRELLAPDREALGRLIRKEG